MKKETKDKLKSIIAYLLTMIFVILIGGLVLGKLVEKEYQKKNKIIFIRNNDTIINADFYKNCDTLIIIEK